MSHLSSIPSTMLRINAFRQVTFVNTLRVFSFGYTSAIEASFIALGLHKCFPRLLHYILFWKRLILPILTFKEYGIWLQTLKTMPSAFLHLDNRILPSRNHQHLFGDIAPSS